MDNRRRMMWKKPPENAIYYTSTDGNIVTPHTSASWGVAKIMSNTYENGEGKIVFDKKVTLFNYSFKNCNTLKTITIPDSVTSIINYSFRGCSNLTSITIPDSVTKIGEWAFAYCNSITSITIPGSVTSIAHNAVSNCSNLTSVTIDNGVTEIGTSMFSECSSLTSVTIPNSVTSIGNHAFSDCTGLTSIDIPDSVTVIGIYSFRGCSNLTSITIPDSVTKIGYNAFYNCTSLASVSMGNNVTSIGTYAFCNCSNLTSITIPDGVTSIENNAFYNCTSLASVSMGNNVTSIGKCAFQYCSSLTSVTIPNSVTSIGEYVFSRCSLLPNVNIPNSVTSIGNYTFSGCSSLTSVDITDLSAWCKISFGNSAASPLHNGAKLYLNGSELTDIAIPSDITEIKNDTFYGCTSLTSITIPDSVTSIGNSAFLNCKSLTNVIIGNGVTTIGEKAFYGCSKLQSLKSNALYPPTIYANTFQSILTNGTLKCPVSDLYTQWMYTDPYYLGYYNWTVESLYTPQTYYNLQITADDVLGISTNTTIYWICLADYDTSDGVLTGVQLTGTVTSEEFPQNTSETETVERTITFEYQGLTASTTITQGVWINPNYELVLNDNWQLSTAVTNPDSALYDGVYESFSNYNVGSTAAIMYIDIIGYETFKLYIRSYAESNYDYVMVSQIDQTIDNNSSYSNTTLVKAHTRGTQKSGTTISDYKLVEFTGLDGGAHRITVVYRKDSSGNSGTDKGYLIIPRQ